VIDVFGGCEAIWVQRDRGGDSLILCNCHVFVGEGTVSLAAVGIIKEVLIQVIGPVGNSRVPHPDSIPELSEEILELFNSLDCRRNPNSIRTLFHHVLLFC
jgi:hypothetical protein